MTNVVPFAPRPSAGGGWTAAERARLSELADQLAAGGAKVEVVYGVTDEGDPWCVIKDDQEEVLIHVARINGAFVVHDASQDTIQQGETLWSACDRMLGGDWRDSREDVVVSLSGRQAQTFIALVVAASFIQQADDAEAAAVVSDADHQTETPPAIMVSVTATQAAGEEPQRQDLLAPQHEPANDDERPAAASLVQAEETAPPQTAPAPEPEPAVATANEDVATPAPEVEPASAPTEAPARSSTLRGDEGDNLIVGGAGHDTIEGGGGDDTLHGAGGDDSLMGGAGADQLYGGEGADTLDGGTAPEGRFDLLDGGDGDDQINLNASTVAKGGEGADTFVFAGPPARDGLMGIVADFSSEGGDRVVLAGANNAKVVSQQTVANVFEGRQEALPGVIIEKVQPGLRIGMDLNGDGQEDGYLLLGRPPADYPYADTTPVAIIGIGYTGEPDVAAMFATLKRLTDDGDFLA